MTLEEHAAAISAAIQSAAVDGYYIDDTDGVTPELDLNDGCADSMMAVRLSVPLPG